MVNETTDAGRVVLVSRDAANVLGFVEDAGVGLVELLVEDLAGVGRDLALLSERAVPASQFHRLGPSRSHVLLRRHPRITEQLPIVGQCVFEGALGGRG